jgi:hypothetical protein
MGTVTQHLIGSQQETPKLLNGEEIAAKSQKIDVMREL